MKSLDLTNKEQALIAIAVSQFMNSLQQSIEHNSVGLVAKSILTKVGSVDQSVLNSLGGNTYEELRTEVQPVNK
jgi:hypothetical protein